MPSVIKRRGRLTPRTKPICTRPGSLRTRPPSSLPALRPHSIRAFSSVAMSIALKGTLLARRMVSSREVAVTMCEDPAVRDVYRYRAGSVEYEVPFVSAIAAALNLRGRKKREKGLEVVQR